MKINNNTLKDMIKQNIQVLSEADNTRAAFAKASRDPAQVQAAAKELGITLDSFGAARTIAGHLAKKVGYQPTGLGKETMDMDVTQTIGTLQGTVQTKTLPDGRVVTSGATGAIPTAKAKADSNTNVSPAPPGKVDVPVTPTVPAAPAPAPAPAGAAGPSLNAAPKGERISPLGMSDDQLAASGALPDKAPVAPGAPAKPRQQLNFPPATIRGGQKKGGPLYTDSTAGGYTIQKGDTLSSVAKKYGLTAQQLIKMNPQIKDPNRIGVGAKISIPGDQNVAPAASGAPATAGSFNISQSRQGVQRESIERQMKDMIKNVLREAQIQPMTGNPQVDMRPMYTDKTAGGYIVKKGDTLTSIAKKYGLSAQQLANMNPQIKNPNAIQIGAKITIPGDKSSGPPTPGPTPAPAPPKTPPVCDVSKRKEDPALVQKLTQQIIGAVKGLTGGGGSVPATYGAQINGAVNQISGLAINGQVAEVYVTQQMQQMLNAGPKAAYAQIQQVLGKRPTGAAVINAVSGLQNLESVHDQCGSMSVGGGGAGAAAPNVPQVTGAIGAKGMLMPEGKFVFKRSYVQKIIREELQKEVKKKVLK